MFLKLYFFFVKMIHSFKNIQTIPKKSSEKKVKTSSGDIYDDIGLGLRSVRLLRIELRQVIDFPNWGEKTHLFNAKVWV